MEERKASRISFLESVSGEVEKPSRMGGVHTAPGSKEEATDSVIDASDNRLVRIKSKSKVVEPVGGHDCGMVGGDMLHCPSWLRSTLAGVGFRVGRTFKHCSRIRTRLSRRTRL